MSNRKLTRREFVGRTAAAVALPALIPYQTLGAARGGDAADRTSAPRPDDPAARTLTTNIRVGDTAARYAAVRQAPLVGTAALAPLAAVWAGEDPAAAKAAGEAVKRIVHHAARRGAPTERQAAARALGGLLDESQPHRVRADSLRLLGFVGGSESLEQSLRHRQ